MIGPLLVIAAGAALGVRAASEPLHAGSKKLSPWALMGDFDRALEEGDHRGAALLILTEAKRTPVETDDLGRKVTRFNSEVYWGSGQIAPWFYLRRHGLHLQRDPRKPSMKELAFVPFRGFEQLEPRRTLYASVKTAGRIGDVQLEQVLLAPTGRVLRFDGIPYALSEFLLRRVSLQLRLGREDVAIKNELEPYLSSMVVGL